MIGIYKITNPKGKIYIGQTWDLTNRENTYSRYNCKGQRKLYNSFKKYGWEQHIFEILKVCSDDTIQTELDDLEIYYLQEAKKLGEVLNIREAGSRGKLSEESKNLIKFHPTRNINISKSLKFLSKPKDFGKNISNTKASNPIKYSDSTCDKIKNKLTNRNINWYDKIVKSKGYEGNTKKPIIQFDLNGIFVKEFESIEQTIRETDIKGIENVLKNRVKTAGGYKWKYKI